MRARLFQTLVVVALALATAGCTNLVFQPWREHVMDPREFGVVLDDLYFEGDDGIRLHGWFLPARGVSRPKGTILFLHGNAQNISTHVASVHWLPQHGYNVYLYDYRGYGKSAGIPDYDWARRDLISAIRMLEKFPASAGSPLIVFGQSLGGSIAIAGLGGNPERLKLAALVTEGAPSSLRDIAREALGSHWLTWTLQYPLSLLVGDEASPLDRVASISPLPLLIVHSEDDFVVPVHHGQRLLAAARQPVRWLPVTGPHIGAFVQSDNQRRLLEFFAAAIPRDDSAPAGQPRPVEQPGDADSGRRGRVFNVDPESGAR